MEILPINQYKKWSESENKKLMTAVRAKKSLVEISKNHRRSINAIKLKIVKNMIEEIKYIREFEYEYKYLIINSKSNESNESNESCMKYKYIGEDRDPSLKYLMLLSNLSKFELLDGFKKLGFKYDYVENDTETEYEDYHIKKYLC